MNILQNRNKKQVTHAVNDVFDQAQVWVKDEIKKQTKDYVQKIIDDSFSTVIPEDNSARKNSIFRSRFYNEEIDKLKIAKTPLGTLYPLAASLPTSASIENLLDNVALTETADAFFADGMLRRIVSDWLDFLLPEYMKHAVTIDKTWVENKSLLDPDVLAEFKEVPKGKIAEFNIRMSKIMENTQLWDNSHKLIATSILFGRNALFIDRDKTDTKFKKYGRPTAFVLLNPLAIKKALVKNGTGNGYQFDGFEYDWGVQDRTQEKISVDNLIPFFYDDFSIYKNTYYSGMTRIFSLIGLAHSNQLINSYDMPEATQSVYNGNNYIFTGSESNAAVDRFAATVKRGNNYHNKSMLRVDAAQASGEIMSIVETRLSNYKSMCMILGIPLFLLFEDEANFATAAIAMQSFINGRVARFGTAFGNAMEQYLLLPTFCDVCDIDIDVFRKSYVNRVKAIMPKITLETKTDRINNAVKIWNTMDLGGVNAFGNSFTAFFKYIGEDQLAEMAEPLDALKQEVIKDAEDGEIGKIMTEDPSGSEIGKRILTNFSVRSSASENAETG